MRLTSQTRIDLAAATLLALCATSLPSCKVLSADDTGAGVDADVGADASPDASPDADAEVVPTYIELLEASVSSTLAVPVSDVGARTVSFRLVVAAAPSCDGTNGGPEYGFMLDTDSDPTTGEVDDAFQGLGVDARVAIFCDPSVGYASDLGTLTVTPDVDGAGATAFTLDVPVAALPSIDFRWIAYAHDTDESFVRLPEAPDVRSWTTVERSWF